LTSTARLGTVTEARWTVNSPASFTDAVAITALVLVLTGTVVILGGVVAAAQSLAMSRNAIEYEVSRTLSLGAGP